MISYSNVMCVQSSLLVNCNGSTQLSFLTTAFANLSPSNRFKTPNSSLQVYSKLLKTAIPRYLGIPLLTCVRKTDTPPLNDTDQNHDTLNQTKTFILSKRPSYLTSPIQTVKSTPNNTLMRSIKTQNESVVNPPIRQAHRQPQRQPQLQNLVCS